MFRHAVNQVGLLYFEIIVVGGMDGVLDLGNVIYVKSGWHILGPIIV